MRRGGRSGIVFQSDDWGFCGWSADRAAWSLSGRGPDAGRRPDYWGSTLESPADLRKLFDVLEKFRGSDGRPPVFQANYILCAPDFDRIKADDYRRWHGIELPDVPPRWRRGDIVGTAKEGILRGVWRPEYHGYTHCDVQGFLARLASKEGRTRLLFDAMSWPLHAEETHSEYWSRIQSGHIARGIRVFEELFGYPPRSAISPNYVWDEAVMDEFRATSIRILQGTNRHVASSESSGARWRFWRLLNRLKKSYFLMERDVDFEPRGQSPEGCRPPAWRRALDEIKCVLSKKDVAVVSTHRLNFVHLDSAWVECGLQQLRLLLDGISRELPQAVYLTDSQVADRDRPDPRPRTATGEHPA